MKESVTQNQNQEFESPLVKYEKEFCSKCVKAGTACNLKTEEGTNHIFVCMVAAAYFETDPDKILLQAQQALREIEQNPDIANTLRSIGALT